MSENIFGCKVAVFVNEVPAVKKLAPMRNLAMIAALALAACATTPEPAPVVEAAPLEVVIYDPVPEPVPEVASVPSIDIEEWERQQAEAAALAAPEVIIDEPAAPDVQPVIRKSVLERAAEAKTPDAMIKILNTAKDSEEKRLMMFAAYEAKQASDEASGNAQGEAEALVYLAKLDAQKNTQDSQLVALKKFAEAQALDPENEIAPSEVSALRSTLQPYADTLHKQAVALFVEQDFAPAVSRWETVLLIDPGNSAARSWFTQANEALGR